MAGLFSLSFHLLTIQLFISTWEKSYEDIHHSPPHVSIITGNILMTIIRFSRYHLLLTSNSTFMADSMYLGTIQICWNLNKHYYLISTTPVIWQVDTNCSPFQSLNILPFHIRFRMFKTNLLGLIPNVSKYYFKQVQFLPFPSFTCIYYFRIDSNRFGTLIWNSKATRS